MNMRGGQASAALIYAGPTPGTFVSTAPNCVYLPLGKVTLKQIAAGMTPSTNMPSKVGEFYIGPRVDQQSSGAFSWDSIGIGSANEDTVVLAFNGMDKANTDMMKPITSRLTGNSITTNNNSAPVLDGANPIFFKLTSADNLSEVVIRCQGVAVAKGVVGLYNVYNTKNRPAVGVAAPMTGLKMPQSSIIKSFKGTPNFNTEYTLSFNQCKNGDTVPVLPPPTFRLTPV